MTANQINYHHFKRMDDISKQDLAEKKRHNIESEKDEDANRRQRLFSDGLKAATTLGAGALKLL